MCVSLADDDSSTCEPRAAPSASDLQDITIHDLHAGLRLFVEGDFFRVSSSREMERWPPITFETSLDPRAAFRFKFESQRGARVVCASRISRG